VYLLVLEISMNLYFVIELVSLFLVWLFELNAGIFIVLSWILCLHDRI
jgi:hypothetical protein